MLDTRSLCSIGDLHEESNYRLESEADHGEAIVEVIELYEHDDAPGRGGTRTVMEQRWRYDPESDVFTPSWTDPPPADYSFLCLCNQSFCHYPDEAPDPQKRP